MNDLSATKKHRIESRIIRNSQFRFCGRTFNCTKVIEMTHALIAFDSYRDSIVEVFDEQGSELGVAELMSMEVSHGG